MINRGLSYVYGASLLFFSAAKRKVTKESAAQKNRARAQGWRTLPFFGLLCFLFLASPAFGQVSVNHTTGDSCVYSPSTGKWTCYHIGVQAASNGDRAVLLSDSVKVYWTPWRILQFADSLFLTSSVGVSLGQLNDSLVYYMPLRDTNQHGYCITRDYFESHGGVQVNSDWNAGTGVAQILNKPTIPAAQVNSDWSAVSGVALILNKPTIPAAQVSSDWSAVSGVAQVLNKPTILTLSSFSATAPVAYNNSTGVFSMAAAATAVDGYLSHTDWNTFNGKQAAGSYILLGSLSGTAPVAYNSGTGVFSMAAATTGVDGYLSHTDWNTFNGKQAAGSYILLGSLSGTAPVAYNNSTGVFSMPVATTSVDGYLSHTDWNTFNNKGAGSVTSIIAGTGLSGGTITTSGTVSMPNVGTAGTYGDATHVAQVTTDAQGRVTAVTNVAVTGGGGGGTIDAVTAGTLTTITVTAHAATFDGGSTGVGTVFQKITLDASATTTITFTHMEIGKGYRLFVTEQTSSVVAFAAAPLVAWGQAGVPVLTGSNGAKDMWEIMYDGTNVWIVPHINFN